MIENAAQQASSASIFTASLSGNAKNNALKAVAKALADNEDAIIAANQADVAQATAEKISSVLLKRLKFDAAKLRDVIDGIHSLLELPDPIGQTCCCTELADGLELFKVSCPIGVLGIVFESRPDALVQISALAIKSGNAVLLKGGSEAARTNKVLAEIIYNAAVEAGLPQGWLALLETRQDVNTILALDDYIDLIIPRGSNEFVKYIMDNTRIAVLGHADGICHVYIDSEADMDKALRIAFDSKCQYPAVCNAMENLLVNKKIAGEFIPRIKQYYDEASVELRGDEKCRGIIDCIAANDQDWRTEYNDMILSIKVVSGLDEAIDFINIYSSGHTDAIVTENRDRAARFMDLIDSGNVFWNCSTRFSDGFRYGLGAEVGISTNKIHARGPVGLEGLTIYKWKMIGSGQTVADFADDRKLRYTHRKLDKKFML